MFLFLSWFLNLKTEARRRKLKESNKKHQDQTGSQEISRALKAPSGYWFFWAWLWALVALTHCYCSLPLRWRRWLPAVAVTVPWIASLVASLVAVPHWWPRLPAVAVTLLWIASLVASLVGTQACQACPCPSLFPSRENLGPVRLVLVSILSGVPYIEPWWATQEQNFEIQSESWADQSDNSNCVHESWTWLGYLGINKIINSGAGQGTTIVEGLRTFPGSSFR